MSKHYLIVQDQALECAAIANDTRFFLMSDGEKQRNAGQWPTKTWFQQRRGLLAVAQGLELKRGE